MDHVECHFNAFSLLAPFLFEGGNLARTIDCHQAGLQVQMGIVALDIFHQGRDIFLDAEQHRTRIVELHVDIAQDACPFPLAARQVHRLLRCAGAFDRHRRLGEQGGAVAHVLDQPVGVGGEVETVIGRDAVLAQCLRQAVNRGPIQLDSRTDDQDVIADLLPVGCHDGIVLRVKAGGRGLDPLRPGRDQVLFLAVRELRGKGAATDHRPAGLVIMVIGGVDDGERDFPVALQHAGGGGDAGGAATDDDNIKAAAASRWRKGFSGCRPRHFGELCRPGTRPAIGERGSGNGGKSRRHFFAVPTGDRTGHRRNIGESQASLFRRLCHSVGARMIAGLLIGPIADDRPEAGRRQRCYIIQL